MILLYRLRAAKIVKEISLSTKNISLKVYYFHYMLIRLDASGQKYALLIG
ncbi:hypothetical protein CLV24_1338 [Pontibacter ummariensis]|uniref:Uncharacterized protein n=1 Tax=Pontibacter ummariensis TaxID=1610492 RepID=A0A239KYS0_9BACT|nr:hypothetical protein CLV24_1338 [Pontibacter ummariensis]SNT23361.1 hypothetical protein SAMN06296052_13334 [Pontibacter ummariensis]